MSQEVAVIREVRGQLDKMAPQFAQALPPGIRAERFTRFAMTAIQGNPDLLKADRRSLFQSCMKAAQAGLMPDGREAALVVYNTKVRDKDGRESWVPAVQYQPMIAGLKKLAFKSGNIADWRIRLVRDGDEFEYEQGDREFIKHKPALEQTGKILAAYSIVDFKDGSTSREVMGIAEIERIRQKSKNSGKGPWVSDFGEMAKKTVGKRHVKSLDLGDDTEEAVQHLNATEGYAAGAIDVPHETVDMQMDAIAAPIDVEEFDGETGEIAETQPAAAPASQTAAPAATRKPGRPAGSTAKPKPAPAQRPPEGQKTVSQQVHEPIDGVEEGAGEDEEARCYSAGRMDAISGKARSVPVTIRYKSYQEAWLKGFDSVKTSANFDKPAPAEPDDDYSSNDPFGGFDGSDFADIDD